MSEATAPAPPHHSAPRRFPALDGLRAIAVLAVVTTHAAFQTGRYERGWAHAALARLDVGVAIFFVISGFLLVQPWFRTAATNGPRPALRIYVVRRVARIMPAYLAAVALALLALPENADASATEWARQMMLLQIYGSGGLREGLTQTWSLSTEVAFYALLPVLGVGTMLLCRRRWRPTAIAVALAVGVAVPIAWYLFLYGQGDRWASGGLWLPGYLGWFASGMALALIRVNVDLGSVPAGSRWSALDSLGRFPFTWWALAVGAFFVAATPIAGPRLLQPPTSWEAVTKSTLYLVVAAAMVAPAALSGSAMATSLLGNRAMRYAGDISYGVFLYHLVVLRWVMTLLGNSIWSGQLLQVLGLTLAASVALAAVSRRFLEEPVLRLAHRGRWRSRVRAPQDATSARA